MTTDPMLAAIQIGPPRAWGQPDATDPFEQPWTTASFKSPVHGPIVAGRLGLAGDGQADLKNHGGPDKAICVYPLEHYPAWATALGRDALEPAAFGENFSVRGLVEADVCIGDVWEMGGAVVQVSQPRQPCWKLARRWRVKDLALQVQRSGQTGWYFRVLVEGLVEAGTTLLLRERPHPTWTIAAANVVMHERKHDLDSASALARLPELSESWRATLTKRVAGAATSSEPRLNGAPT